MNSAIKSPAAPTNRAINQSTNQHVYSSARPIETLLARLDQPKETSADQWLARCPGHEDKSPSLAIRELSDGRILLHCFAGCGAADVLASIGLSLADLYPDDRPQHARRTAPGARWNYRDILRVVGRELTLVQICASDMARGQVLPDIDRKRLDTAAQRIRRAVEVAR